MVYKSSSRKKRQLVLRRQSSQTPMLSEKENKCVQLGCYIIHKAGMARLGKILKCIYAVKTEWLKEKGVRSVYSHVLLPRQPHVEFKCSITTVSLVWFSFVCFKH